MLSPFAVANIQGFARNEFSPPGGQLSMFVGTTVLPCSLQLVVLATLFNLVAPKLPPASSLYYGGVVQTSASSTYAASH
eukprot:2305784-Pyramimonas_sp.AAC.1